MEEKAVSPEKEEKSQDIAIVALGASAGGLDAFKKFFLSMPADSGMAFVLIQHLDPSHESLMVDLLARQTRMQVFQAEDGIPIRPNSMYIIPPNKYLTIGAGKLHLLDPVERRGMRMPIDFFFRSLAEDRREKAICIILSGTGSDGTLGLRAIKEFGGMVMVQDPEEAAYDGMPRSAINTGMVDYVLTAENMPEVLVRYVGHSYINTSPDESVRVNGPFNKLNGILALLRTRTNYDFRYYKKNTLVRRIERRMSLSSIEDMDSYLMYVRERPDELKMLFKDLLISVTQFFRDTETMEELQKEIIPELVRKAEPDQPLRVWIPGCATGEEAYTIAMILIEEFNKANKTPDIQIFATDIDEDALEFARNGVYLDSISADVSQERLKRFFIKENQAYKVNKQLRESIVFAVQNLITDPPFSKLDLITCRNVLIYLEGDTQQKIMQLFHLALRDEGFLFLGPSETVGRKDDMFRTISKQHRIYKRIGPARRGTIEFPIAAPYDKTSGVYARDRRLKREPTSEEVTRGLLLEHFAPPSILVNADYTLEYFYGDTRRYLMQPAGEPTRDLFKLCRPEIRSKLRAAVFKARQEAGVITAEDIKLSDDRGKSIVSIRVIPQQGGAGSCLISFEERPLPDVERETNASSSVNEDIVVRQLEFELHAAREELQGTIEEMETSNEELKASNEEVMSMNEELQSTNEELETSKEELQSLNEELTTVNNELQEKVAELESANNDFSNLLSSTEVATIFLDTELMIKRFTPSATKALNLIPTDVNRPISDVSRRVNDLTLLDDARLVLEKLIPSEKEVQADGDESYLRRILPYRTQENKIEGVVITFTEISLVKNAQIKLKRSEESLAEAQRIAHLGSWNWDVANDRLSWSDEVYRIFAVNRSRFNETYEGFLELVDPEDRSLVEEGVERSLKDKEPYNIDHRIMLPDGSRKYVQERGRVFSDERGEPVRMLGTILDITRRKEVESQLKNLNETLELRVSERTARLRESEELFRSLIDNAGAEILLQDTAGRFLLANRHFLESRGLTLDRVIGRTLGELYGEETYRPFRELDEAVLRDGEVVRSEIKGPDIGYGSSELLATRFPVHDLNGDIKAIGAIHTDISELKNAIRELETARGEAESASRAKSEFLSAMSHELRTPLNAILGFGQLLYFSDGSKTGGEGREYVGEILNAGKHLLELIDQLLNLSRIEAGTLSMSLESVPVSAIVDSCLSMAGAMSPSYEVTVRGEYRPESNLSVFADLTRARQVLLNLLSNGIKYNRRGGEVVLDVKATSSDMIRFLVTDSGPGISDEEQKNIFTPFHRMGGSTSPTEGAGLGLSISRELVSLMKGDIGFRSLPEQGCVFWFDLPRAESPALGVQTEEDPTRKETAPGVFTTRAVVLYIEDNPANLNLMKGIIARIQGLELRTAETAEEGLEILRSEPPDIVFMDINLPGMSGLEAIDQLKAEEKTREIPVIAVSAAAMKADADAALKRGAVEYITKPYRVEEIEAAIRRVLKLES